MYLWLIHPDKIDDDRWQDFQAVRKSKLKTARAWAIKETAMAVWDESWTRSQAESGFKRWYSWAIRSRLEPIKRVARMIKRHWDGVINSVVERVTNAAAEGLNSVVQQLISSARGFRNRKRFMNAIYFHLGGLELHPTGMSG